MQLALIARHGQSILNVEGVVNGDPARDQGLSDLGREEAASLGHQIAAVAIDLCIVTEFRRTHETAELARPGLPQIVEPGLNDIQVGELEGRTLDDYRTWKHAHTRDDPFPGGESLSDAASRYADAFERVLARPEHTILVVCHEIPLRYAINAAAGSPDLDAPVHDVANATPYVFDADGLRAAAENIKRA